MERVFRQKAMDKDLNAFEDSIFRSWGLLSNARRMPVKEFMAHWSNLRMGAALNKLPVSLAVCDRLLTQAQPAHVQKSLGAVLNDREADARRSQIIREAINGGT